MNFYTVLQQKNQLIAHSQFMLEFFLSVARGVHVLELAQELCGAVKLIQTWKVPAGSAAAVAETDGPAGAGPHHKL